MQAPTAVDLLQYNVGRHCNPSHTARRPSYAGSQYLSQLPDSVVAATFHTHPNPSGEGWEPGPSAADTQSAFSYFYMLPLTPLVHQA